MTYEDTRFVILAALFLVSIPAAIAILRPRNGFPAAVSGCVVGVAGMLYASGVFGTPVFVIATGLFSTVFIVPCAWVFAGTALWCWIEFVSERYSNFSLRGFLGTNDDEVPPKSARRQTPTSTDMRRIGK